MKGSYTYTDDLRTNTSATVVGDSIQITMLNKGRMQSLQSTIPVEVIKKVINGLSNDPLCKHAKKENKR